MFRLCAILVSLLPGGVPASSMDVVRAGPPTVGSAVEQVQQRLGPLCAPLDVRVAMRPAAPLVRSSRHPVADGILQGGQPREVVLVFQDNRLDLAWVLFPAGEKTAFLQAFTARYGKPSLQLGFGSVYLAASAVVRDGPAEAGSASARQARAAMATRKAPAVDAPASPSALNSRGESR